MPLAACDMSYLKTTKRQSVNTTLLNSEHACCLGNFVTPGCYEAPWMFGHVTQEVTVSIPSKKLQCSFRRQLGFVGGRDEAFLLLRGHGKLSANTLSSDVVF